MCPQVSQVMVPLRTVAVRSGSGVLSWPAVSVVIDGSSFLRTVGGTGFLFGWSGFVAPEGPRLLHAGGFLFSAFGVWAGLYAAGVGSMFSYTILPVDR